MADYTVGTGNGGVMLIRDTGNAVEFWIKSGSTSTFKNEMAWSWTINGSSGNEVVSYPSGAAWLLVGAWTVTSSQDVRFYLSATGTYGLGGPTDFWQHIDRAPAVPTATVPPPPSQVRLSSITGTSMVAMFDSQGDGGATVTEWNIGYGTDPNYPQYFVASGGTSTITGLALGTTYYFWARGFNAVGAGGWSAWNWATTLNVPGFTSPVNLSAPTQTSIYIQFSGGTDGGSPITAWQLGYGTDPSYPQTIIGSGGTNTVINLAPGSTYYFWARGINAVGNGPWSVRTSIRTIAGARVRVGGVWKEAIPYVKIGGVWKLAKPWVNVNGVWKPTA